MSHYAEAAEFYDLLYAKEKDYAAESVFLAELIREANPSARRLLDVGCGTGEHARALISHGFEVDGVDAEPAFLEIARRKCPGARLTLADMRSLALNDRYDAVLTLFSAIGYVRDLDGLTASLRSMAAHLAPDGVLIVDPWFEPGHLTNGHIGVLTAEAEDVKICRMSRTVIDGTESTIEFTYLIGRPHGIETRREDHTLGLFTQSQMEAAFGSAGLAVKRIPKALRGIYVGRR